MKDNIKFFKDKKIIPIDNFFYNVLYKYNSSYYNSKSPFGIKGDFITAPKISNLFSEMIAVWIISTWQIFGKPKIFNIVELGPGEGDLVKTLIKVSRKFPEFDNAKRIFLYEISGSLKNLQKKNLKNENVKWIKNFNVIKKGPVIFFGNEFFDAIPIKQFKREKNELYEKFYFLDKKYAIKELFKKSSIKDKNLVNSFKTFKKINFIEFPKKGLEKLKDIINKIIKLKGCLLIVDYGYLKTNNQNTLQSVINHKKNNILQNLGNADVTSHVNFELLREFFLKNNLKVKKTITQKEFLKNMGIIERAEIISSKMKFSEKTNLYLRLKRLISPRLMGELFKVILAYKFNNNKYFGFK